MKGGQGDGLTLFLLRAWLWLVPTGMLASATVFSVVAALSERWALMAVMILIGLLAIGLLIFHFWLVYRFGSEGGRS